MKMTMVNSGLRGLSMAGTTLHIFENNYRRQDVINHHNKDALRFNFRLLYSGISWKTIHWPKVGPISDQHWVSVSCCLGNHDIFIHLEVGIAAAIHTSRWMKMTIKCLGVTRVKPAMLVKIKWWLHNFDCSSCFMKCLLYIRCSQPEILYDLFHIARILHS